MVSNHLELVADVLNAGETSRDKDLKSNSMLSRGDYLQRVVRGGNCKNSTYNMVCYTFTLD